MRVTKIIREYVEKTITSKLPYGEPTAEFKAARQTLDNLRDKLEKETRAYAEQRIASVTSDLPEGFKLSLGGSSFIHASHYGAPLSIAANEHEYAIRKKREAAIESILVELELGATKADLERLISEAIEM